MDQQEKPTHSKKPYPPSEFWRALLTVRNKAFAEGLNEYFAEIGVPREGSFRDSVDVVDNYLNLAIEDGWLDDWTW